MTTDLEILSMSELVQLQGRVIDVLRRRFERSLALLFTDVVGSTPYFARFGDVAGRALQQSHVEHLTRALTAGQGRIVDTAGDGAFSVFASVDGAINTIVKLLGAINDSNATRQLEHHLVLRCGLHWGAVLTDGVMVSGDAVNVASRIAGSCPPSEVRLSKTAVQELGGRFRMRCHSPAQTELKGVLHPVELFVFEWRDPTVFPTKFHVVELNQEVVLPSKDLVSVGRLKEHDGRVANDVVLMHPDPQAAMRISRWHFELRRYPTGMTLRAVSDQPTEVDDVAVARGVEVAIRPGSVVKVARVLTLHFLVDPRSSRREDDPQSAGTLGFTIDREKPR
jgi:class 3 adenylate cyclase